MLLPSLVWESEIVHLVNSSEKKLLANIHCVRCPWCQTSKGGTRAGDSAFTCNFWEGAPYMYSFNNSFNTDTAIMGGHNPRLYRYRYRHHILTLSKQRRYIRGYIAWVYFIPWLYLRRIGIWKASSSFPFPPFSFPSRANISFPFPFPTRIPQHWSDCIRFLVLFKQNIPVWWVKVFLKWVWSWWGVIWDIEIILGLRAQLELIFFLGPKIVLKGTIPPTRLFMSFYLAKLILFETDLWYRGGLGGGDRGGRKLII